MRNQRSSISEAPSGELPGELPGPAPGAIALPADDLSSAAEEARLAALMASRVAAISGWEQFVAIAPALGISVEVALRVATRFLRLLDLFTQEMARGYRDEVSAQIRSEEQSGARPWSRPSWRAASPTATCGGPRTSSASRTRTRPRSSSSCTRTQCGTACGGWRSGPGGRCRIRGRTRS